MMAKKPIIICGFHHSGTRLVSRILKKEGVFQVINTPTKEWSLIQKINNRIGNWNKIDKIDEVKSIKFTEKIRLAYGLAINGYNFTDHWGFKDPRNCVTIESWLDLFKRARVIHVVRHPVDAIGTLPNEYEKHRNKNKKKEVFWTELWNYYNINVKSIKKRCEEYVLLRFEDMCMKPNETIRRVKKKCGIKVNGVYFDVSKINREKAYIHKRKNVDAENVIRSSCKDIKTYNYK